jgi:hypothetical protein
MLNLIDRPIKREFLTLLTKKVNPLTIVFLFKKRFSLDKKILRLAKYHGSTLIEIGQCLAVPS